MPSRLTIIVATDAERGIGVNNTLPWHLPEDLAFFKRTTSGHSIIMGRKTFDSIGRALPNRRNIVITRNPQWEHDGVIVATSLDEAISLAGSEPAFIIGGAQIFAESLPLVQHLLVTEIDKVFHCDTFLPAINWQEWREISRETHYSDANQCNFAFVSYERQAR